mmetsp:Transcript_34493/g.42535  ORF Transcript_34493/g.42535 Transcript_34493/m.42535 type:complete len:141 (+) Transcript_34493:695-1117(+)
MQNRESGHVKPKAYNAWDILALNDLIKDKIENQQLKQKQHQERIQMRRFYDDQIQQKKIQKQHEKYNDVQLGQHIKEKVSTINRLMDLDSNKRNMVRGQVALENITAANMAKQKQEIVENQAKFETIDTLNQSNIAALVR